jgi:ribosomal protein S27E
MEPGAARSSLSHFTHRTFCPHQASRFHIYPHIHQSRDFDKSNSLNIRFLSALCSVVDSELFSMKIPGPRRTLLLGWSFATAFRPSAGFLIAFDRTTLNISRGDVDHKFYSRCTLLQAKPKRGGVVDSYQTVSVNCSKCGERLFRYKKKNGTKSNLVKCYIERISEDSAGLLAKQESSGIPTEEFQWSCQKCGTTFARPTQIHGLPALKMVGGKVRMTKK